MDVLFRLLTVYELYNMIVLEAFHDGDFTLEVLQQFCCQFRPDDGFDGDDGPFTLQRVSF